MPDNRAFSEADIPDFLISNGFLVELMQETLARDVPFCFRARGESMTPFIRDGDVIKVMPLRARAVGMGAVVAFKRPQTGALVVHRVVGVSDEAALIHADNIPQVSDGWVPYEYMLGRVTEIRRNGRGIWLGLGPERYAIAFLTRKGWLNPLRAFVAGLRGRR